MKRLYSQMGIAPEIPYSRLQILAMAAGNQSIPNHLTAMELMLFYYQERALYARLVGPLSQNPEKTKWVISLWLWIESIGLAKFISCVAASTDSILLRFVNEGKACLKHLVIGQGSVGDLPFTSSLMAKPIDLGFFHNNRELALKGVMQTFEKIYIVFSDYPIIEEMVRMCRRAFKTTTSNGPIHIRPFGEGTSEDGGYLVDPSAITAGLPVPSFGVPPLVKLPVKSLNPNAEPWKPITKYEAINHRTMILSFPKVYPISKEEIIEFFNMKYWNCVETVIIVKEMNEAQEVFGWIIFNRTSVIEMILNGMEFAEFIIGGKHLIARRFIP